MQIHQKMQELRNAGCKLRVTHFRVTDRGVFTNKELATRERDFVISPCGGRVEVEIETPEGVKVQAASECSMQDNFKRRIGTAIAFGRACKALEGIVKL